MSSACRRSLIQGPSYAHFKILTIIISYYCTPPPRDLLHFCIFFSYGCRTIWVKFKFVLRHNGPNYNNYSCIFCRLTRKTHIWRILEIELLSIADLHLYITFFQVQMHILLLKKKKNPVPRFDYFIFTTYRHIFEIFISKI